MRVLQTAFAACVFFTYFSGMMLLSAVGTRMIVQAVTTAPFPFL